MATSDEIRKRLQRAGEQLLREFKAADVTDSDGIFAVHIKNGTVTVEAVPVDERTEKKKARANAVQSNESVPPAGSE